MNAFVTGASGFLGGWLVERLLDRGDRVVGLVRDRLSQFDWKPSPSPVTYVAGDLSSALSIERILGEYEIDCVFHLAAQAQMSVAHANPIETFDANIRGTWNVLEAARRQKVKRVVVASSDKSYGATDLLPYKETHPLAGTAPYEVSKSCADLIATSFACSYGMSIGTTRCGNLFGGRHLNFSTLIPGTIKRILEGKRPTIHGDGTTVREFLYVEDAVDAYLALAESDAVGAFNFGSGEPISVRDMVGELLTIMGSSLTAEHLPGAPAGIPRQALDSTRAQVVLGWRPRHSMFEGLIKTVKWYYDYFDGSRRLPALGGQK